MYHSEAHYSPARIQILASDGILYRSEAHYPPARIQLLPLKGIPYHYEAHYPTARIHLLIRMAFRITTKLVIRHRRCRFFSDSPFLNMDPSGGESITFCRIPPTGVDVVPPFSVTVASPLASLTRFLFVFFSASIFRLFQEGFATSSGSEAAFSLSTTRSFDTAAIYFSSFYDPSFVFRIGIF